jgi:enoyl-CoA hydratase
MSDAVRVEREGAVMQWTICREARRNAVNLEVVAGLEVAVQAALDDTDIRAVVLRGEGERAFVSGADLSLLVSTVRGGDAAEAERAAFNHRVRSVLDRVARLPLPVIAAIQGHVMGGGCEIAVACDIRVADETASFTFKHAAMGVTPGWGGLGRLARLVPRGMASRLLMSGLPLDAQAAARAGLVDELVPVGQVLPRAMQLAAAAAQLSPEAIATMKSLLARAYDGSGDADSEREAFEARATSSDHAESLHAYAEGRSPVYAKRPSHWLDL